MAYVQTSLVRSSLVFACITLASCQSHKVSNQNVKGFSADSSAHNVAVLIQGNLEPGINDVNRVANALSDSTGNYNFEIVKVPNATSQDALAAVKNAAPKVDPNGTLFLFFAGHGSPDGGVQMNDSMLVNYFEIRSAIAKARTVPVKRLVIMIFACYSGSWINNISTVDPTRAVDLSKPTIPQMSQKVTDRAVAQLAPSVTDRAEPIYQELLILTSSSAEELSYFNGEGSEFVESFSEIFSSLKKNKAETATIQELVDQLRRSISSSTVTSAASPKDLMQEKLFSSAPSTPSIQQSDLFASLDAAQSDGSANILISSGIGLKEVRFCVNSAQYCLDNLASAYEFAADVAPSGSKRSFFKSTASVSLADLVDKSITLLGIGSDGKVQSVRPIQIKKK